MSKYDGIIELIVRLVIRKDDKVLLCQNKSTGNYFLPGGHVEFGDTLEKTMYKELGEELGWTKDDIESFSFKGYLENAYGEEGEKHCEINMIFDLMPKPGVKAESQEDHIGFRWASKEELSVLKILPTEIMPFLS